MLCSRLLSLISIEGLHVTRLMRAIPVVYRREVVDFKNSTVCHEVHRYTSFLLYTHIIVLMHTAVFSRVLGPFHRLHQLAILVSVCFKSCEMEQLPHRGGDFFLRSVILQREVLVVKDGHGFAESAMAGNADGTHVGQHCRE